MGAQGIWKSVVESSRKFLDPARDWARKYLPPGLRLIVGLVLIAGGILGFLPILGFWMIPLGLSIAALDIMPIWRWWTGRKKADD